MTDIQAWVHFKAAAQLWSTTTRFFQLHEDEDDGLDRDGMHYSKTIEATQRIWPRNKLYLQRCYGLPAIIIGENAEDSIPGASAEDMTTRGHTDIHGQTYYGDTCMSCHRGAPSMTGVLHWLHLYSINPTGAPSNLSQPVSLEHPIHYASDFICYYIINTLLRPNRPSIL